MTAVNWLQLLPIGTHRPTQGISAAVVEKASLQVESGWQPFYHDGFRSGEFVLQVRYGIGTGGELLATGGVGYFPWRVTPLSVAIKKALYTDPAFSSAVALWGYPPLSQHPMGGQVWLVGDLPLWKGAVLTGNFIGGYFQSGGQIVLPFFLTQSLLKRWSTWVEGFIYLPARPIRMRGNKYGAGAGFQVVLGNMRLSAADVAFNCDSEGTIQLMIGLSAKRVLHRKD
ncbi:MAG: hypothetical protein ABDH66_02835 [Bacteroidia bacterium]